jgi:hypothetical protein
MSRMRSTLTKTRQNLTSANRRSRKWKHYAHILEIRTFGLTDARTAFRSRYVPDFQGWGSDEERTDVQSR